MTDGEYFGIIAAGKSCLNLCAVVRQNLQVNFYIGVGFHEGRDLIFLVFVFDW